MVFLVAVLIRLVALPFGSALALVSTWFALPLLIEMLWVSTDPPRSRLVRWWTAGLVLLLLADIAAEALTDSIRLAAVSGLLILAMGAQWSALWPFRHETFLTYEKGWIWIYVVGFGTLVFAVVGPAGALLVPVLLAALAAAVVGVLASGLGLLAAGGGILAFLAACVVLISGSLGTAGPATAIGSAVLGMSGQALMLLAIIKHEERELDGRREPLVARLHLTPESEGRPASGGHQAACIESSA